MHARPQGSASSTGNENEAQHESHSARSPRTAPRSPGQVRSVLGSGFRSVSSDSRGSRLPALQSAERGGRSTPHSDATGAEPRPQGNFPQGHRPSAARAGPMAARPPRLARRTAEPLPLKESGSVLNCQEGGLVCRQLRASLGIGKSPMDVAGQSAAWPGNCSSHRAAKCQEDQHDIHLLHLMSQASKRDTLGLAVSPA